MHYEATPVQSANCNSELIFLSVIVFQTVRAFNLSGQVVSLQV